jgi:hypothetical protein|tara:strand:+ start:21367 stop:22401 length:1035 start_codon:yes stop_codon:yes gene_type:complete
MRINPGNEGRHQRPWELPDKTEVTKKARKPIRESASFWIGIAVILLLGLLWFPLIGTIAAILGAFVLSAALINILALSIGLEALLGRIPRWLIALPVLYFGGYYAVLITERWEFQATEQRLQSENAQTARPSDMGDRPVMVPYRYRMLAAQYELEGVYAEPYLGPTADVTSRWTPIIEQRAPYGRETRNLPCNRGDHFARDSASDWLLPQTDHLVTLEDVFIEGKRFGFCVQVSIQEAGSDVIEVRETSHDMDGVGYDFQATEFLATADGEFIGSAITARTSLLSPIPFLMSGCLLISGPSAHTECNTRFRAMPVSLSTDPNQTLADDRSGPAIALDLQARTIQ